MTKNPVEEWTEQELWDWAQERAIECTQKIIAFYRKKLTPRIVFSDELIDPADFENIGPAQHVKLSSITKEDLERLRELDRQREHGDD